MLFEETKCICNQCEHREVCGLNKKAIQPAIKILNDNLCDMSDDFLRGLNNLITNEFTCEFFKKDKNQII